MPTEIYYDHAWINDTIEQLQYELNLVCELEQNLQHMREQPLKTSGIYDKAFEDLLTLKKSIQTTKNALEVFADMMKRNLKKAESDYEIEMEKASALFSGK